MEGRVCNQLKTTFRCSHLQVSLEMISRMTNVKFGTWFLKKTLSYFLFSKWMLLSHFTGWLSLIEVEATPPLLLIKSDISILSFTNFTPTYCMNEKCKIRTLLEECSATFSYFDLFSSDDSSGRFHSLGLSEEHPPSWTL